MDAANIVAGGRPTAGARLHRVVRDLDALCNDNGRPEAAVAVRGGGPPGGRPTAHCTRCSTLSVSTATSVGARRATIVTVGSVTSATAAGAVR